MRMRHLLVLHVNFLLKRQWSQTVEPSIHISHRSEGVERVLTLIMDFNIYVSDREGCCGSFFSYKYFIKLQADL